ncbi:MAG: hypothetical protein SFZ24_12735 [Planctomycetota bacterium]|nr:hypothetical protein [Planctomycetota bacterium]
MARRHQDQLDSDAHAEERSITSVSKTDEGNAADARLKAMLRGEAPANEDDLRLYLRCGLEVEVPDEPVLESSCAPLDYLNHAFFEVGGRTGSDAVVLASRGAGKTFYAAVATALDLLFKPGIEVKILAGSLEQARRMLEHLRRLFEKPATAGLIDGKFRERGARLTNGSSVEILAQSQASVRGARPQKLRCDEVELFDPDIWRAAQLVPRSKVCGAEGRRVRVRGSIEALSTMHRPAGLMAALLADAEPFQRAAREGDEMPSGAAAAGGVPARGRRTLFRWTAIDVLERCGPERECGACGLQPDCAGRAKRERTPGHFYIDDALAIRVRTDEATWSSEMLCRRPSRRGAVFPEFDPAVHVFGPEEMPAAPGCQWIGGMDFGLRTSAVLWGAVDGAGVLRIVAERVVHGVLLGEHAESLRTGNPAHPSARDGAALPVPAWLAVDPAGQARSDQTGQSAVALLRRAGLCIRWRREGLAAGLLAVRARLGPSRGGPTLLVARSCTRLIEALLSYRYPDDAHAEQPLKDGVHDHPADALRYMITVLDGGMSGDAGTGGGLRVSRYA